MHTAMHGAARSGHAGARAATIDLEASVGAKAAALPSTSSSSARRRDIVESVELTTWSHQIELWVSRAA